MLRSLTIKNFRCFHDLALGSAERPLHRFNLIAGKNNTGKTALLEAISLHNEPANWQLSLDINRLRGIEDPGRALEDVCGWLFWNKQPEGGLEIGSLDDKDSDRRLTICILDSVTARERFPDAEKALGTMGGHGPRLLLKYQQDNEPAQISTGTAGTGEGGTRLTWGARIPWNLPGVYLSPSVITSARDVDFFGKLEGAKRQADILPALQILEPRLERLALLPLAGQSVIHGGINLPRLVPLPFMGEGVRRALSIVLAIANAPGGVVLIDEIENGLHYSVMKDVWQAIAVAARQADVQLFATTHSYECIQAAHAAFTKDRHYDLRLVRLDRVDSEVRVAAYDQTTLETAVEMNLEVR